MLLGIETATELVGVAVGDAGGVRATSTVTGRRRHVESLAPAINHVLSQAGVAIGELNAVCVDVGRGCSPACESAWRRRRGWCRASASGRSA